MNINDLTITVCCNKKDFFLARICIASIRYYYPSIDIELIKDLGNGKFSSRELEKYFDVKVVDLGIKKLGWSGAKFHYLYQKQHGKKVLILDADIVFIGPFLERLLPIVESNDYVVSIQEKDSPYTDWAKNTYFDVEAIQAAYPSYTYPGYFFNAGQIFLTLGAVDENKLSEFFNPREYPFWLKQELFPMVDQSIYNYLLPTLCAEKKIKLGTEDFTLWGMANDLSNISLKEIADKTIDSGLIHWAGCLRYSYTSKMARGDILAFFEDYYYSRVKLGSTLQIGRKVKPVLEYYLKQLFYKLKPSKMVKRIRKIVEREKSKHPGKSGISLLKNRLIQLGKYKLGQLIMFVKKDSTFKSMDDLFMCSLFPQKVLNLVIEELKPNSVLDVGCGVGNSLRHYLNNGIDAWGIENSSIAISHSPVKKRIIKHNLKRQLNLNKEFDLVWCFEVIEHIHPDYEGNFLATLTNHSTKILISAARPGQGGHGHFNEKPAEYWITKFSTLGYKYEEQFTLKARSTKETHSENLLFFIKN